MRWSVVLLAACSTAQTPAPTLSSRATPTAPDPEQEEFIASARGSAIYGFAEMPPLPAKRGIDLAEERTCRTHLEHVRRAYVEDNRSVEVVREDVRRLINVASMSIGDCRIDTDAFFAEWTNTRIGGCTGTPVSVAFEQWQRLAAVASTKERRAVALQNLALLSELKSSTIEDWIRTGDHYIAAARASDDGVELESRAIDAYQSALKLKKLTPAAVESIAKRLESIKDGYAGDRARTLRAKLRY